MTTGRRRTKGENSFIHQKNDVDRYTSHETFSRHILTLITPTSWLKVSLVRIHSICMSSMMSHERSLLFSLFCSHSSSFLTPSLFLSSSTSPITLPDKNPTAVIPRNEDRGSLAITTPLTGYEPNVPDNFDDIEVTTSIFQSSSVGDNSTESPDPEIDDEHIRNALASPLYIQKRGANASQSQVYHSNEESSLPGAQSIFAGTEDPYA